MSPNTPNPFSGGEDAKWRAGGSLRQRVAQLPSAVVSASLAQTAFGWEAQVDPVRAFDALRPWPRLAADEECAALLFDVTLNTASRGESGGRVSAIAGDAAGTTGLSRVLRPTDPAESEPQSIGAIARRMSIPTLEPLDDERLIMDSMHLRELVGMIDSQNLRCVLVEGPIEQRDARAIERAVAMGISPLQVELRAVASLDVRDDRHVTLQTRAKAQSLALVAECLRMYLSVVRKRPIAETALPEVWQVERLLDVSGTISVRPIETDTFSTFVDVGISTATEPFRRPADRSLIYDLPSNTWHDEQ